MEQYNFRFSKSLDYSNTSYLYNEGIPYLLIACGMYLHTLSPGGMIIGGMKSDGMAHTVLLPTQLAVYAHGSRPTDSNNTYTLHVEGYNELLIMRAQYMHTYRPGTSTDRNAQCADGSCHISLFLIDRTNNAQGSR